MSRVYSSITLMADAVSSLISIGGAELGNSRRVVDLQNMEACRLQYSASSVITVSIEYSDDWGVTWHSLINEYSMTGTRPRVSGWQVIPEDAKEQEITLRAVAIGSGVLTTVDFVEFQFR